MNDPHSRLLEAMQLHRSGQIDAAAEIYRAVTEAEPGNANAWHLLGLASFLRGNSADAVESIAHAVTIAPGQAIYYNTYGAALLADRQPYRARSAFHRAIELNPNYDEAWCNLGNVLGELGLFAEAAAAYRRAVEIRPNYVNAIYGLGNVLIRAQQFAESIDCFRRVTQLEPNHTDAWNNLGNMLQERGELLEAARCYEQALALQPAHILARENYGTALWSLGNIQAAIATLREIERYTPPQAPPSSRLLLALNYDPTLDARMIAFEHRRWGQRYGQFVRPLPPPVNTPDPDRTLRVAYLSGDFREHAVARFMIPILSHHDRAAVQTIAYSDAPFPDDVTRQIESLVAEWRPTDGWSDERLARQLRDDRIDVLVDLSGHTSLSRLAVLASKAAPIQVTYLGYANTTGLSTVDYLLTDSIVDPPGDDDLYTEQLERIDPCFCCFAPPTDAPDVSPLPALRNGYITFGSLHGLAKMNAHVFDQWVKLLAAIPDARLLLHRHTLHEPIANVMRENFRVRGIDPSRLTIERQPPPGERHLSVYRQIDIALDVFPWSGHTTACEALWMGVPVVTLNGLRRAGRLVASVLTAVGHPEWIARYEKEYVERAVILAANVARLAEIRGSLREQVATSVLCDGAGFTRRLETAYRSMWRRWCQNTGK